MSVDFLNIPTPASVKSAAAFKTISEVAEETGVPQHVLRFWEGKFPQLRPLKRGGGRRYYRPEDVALLRRIHRLLHEEGYTIKGVQKVLREQLGETVVPPMPKPAPNSFSRTRQSVATGQSHSVVLDVELLGNAGPESHAHALRRLIADLRQLRDSLDDV